MIPILYASTATTFSNNGIGRLSECAYCTVTEERNGVFELELQLPNTAPHYDDIDVESIIVAQPRPGASGQPFRVYQITKPLNGVVTVYARHISYELNKIVAMPFTASSCAGAFAVFASKAATTCPFTFWTDKVVSANFNLEQPDTMRAILGGQSGSFLDVFGAGEYEFDGYLVKLHQNRGVDRGVTIRYGKNLTALEDATDTENVFTGVVPFYHTELSTVVLPEKVLWGDHQNDYPYGMTVPLDLSSQFEQPPTVSQLRAAAQAYLNKSTGWQIKNNIKISFVNLADTEEYKNIAVLERVNLCDTVTVVHPGLGVEATAKVVQAVYDTLQERYISLELGATRTNLSQAITDSILEEVPTSSMLQEAIEHATKMITGGLGGYVQFTYNANGQPEELLILNNLDRAQATSVWRWNLGGLGHGTSYDRPADDIALTADGCINASMITTGQLNANIIKTGTITDPNNYMSIDVANGIITLSNSNKLRISAGNLKLDSSGNLTITGNITATSGYIGGTSGFTINSTKLYNGKSTLNSTASGVYVGTNGIAVGAFVGGTANGTGFKVTSDGVVTAGGLKFFTGNSTATSTYGLWAKNGGTHIGSGGPCDFNSEGDGTTDRRNYLRNGTTLDGGTNAYGGIWLSGDLSFDTSKGYNINGLDALNARGKLYTSGTVEAYGATFNGVRANGCSLLSDERMKDDITDLGDRSEFIDALRPVRFRFKDGERYHHGFLAQEMREALHDDQCDIVSEAPTGMLGIRYQELTADLVAVVQAQRRRIDELEARLSRIEMMLEGDGK